MTSGFERRAVPVDYGASEGCPRLVTRANKGVLADYRASVGSEFIFFLHILSNVFSVYTFKP